MVPDWKEPLYSWLLDFISEKRITFAASNFDTTSELTLQIVWWGYYKSASYETDNKQQQEHHEQES